MEYIQIEIGRLILDLQQGLIKTVTENQTDTVQNLNHTGKLALSAALENDTLIAVYTFVLQDSLNSENLLTANTPSLMTCKDTMLPVTHYIYSTAQKIPTTLATKKQKQKLQQAASARLAYTRYLHNRRGAPARRWVLPSHADYYTITFWTRSGKLRSPAPTLLLLTGWTNRTVEPRTDVEKGVETTEIAAA